MLDTKIDDSTMGALQSQLENGMANACCGARPINQAQINTQTTQRHNRKKKRKKTPRKASKIYTKPPQKTENHQSSPLPFDKARKTLAADSIELTETTQTDDEPPDYNTPPFEEDYTHHVMLYTYHYQYIKIFCLLSISLILYKNTKIQ